MKTIQLIRFGAIEELYPKVIRREDEILINRKKIKRLMQVMVVYTIFPMPNPSKKYHAQFIRPYLLRNLPITWTDQVWGVVITYIRMEKVFMSLFVILDWSSRKNINFELSNKLDKAFVVSFGKELVA